MRTHDHTRFCACCAPLDAIKVALRPGVMALMLLAVLVSTPVLANGVGFAPGLSDMPLMDGLAGEDDISMVFDTADGRLVESFASGPVTAAAVRQFYTATLPQLGWQLQATGDGKLRFSRDDELLTIDFPGDQGTSRTSSDLMVRFTLAPEDGG